MRSSHVCQVWRLGSCGCTHPYNTQATLPSRWGSLWWCWNVDDRHRADVGVHYISKQAHTYVRPHQITQQTLAAHCGDIEAFIHLNQFARESCVCVRDAKHIEDWNMWRHSCQILIVGHMLEIMLILIRFLLHQPHIRAARQISLIFLSTWILWELEMAVILVKSQVMSWSLLNFTCVEPF